jgi:hypothetical protein
MRIKTQFITYLGVVSVLFVVPSAFAGKLDVVNENKKALTVRIKADGGNMGENLATYVKEIPAEYYFTFIVDNSDLKGKSHYSIKGDTSAFTSGDKCQHLSVEKNYRVTFLNNTVGTTCVAEEIK